MIESILRGEKAILSEIDLNRKRDDRNKLLRFNVFPNKDEESKAVKK